MVAALVTTATLLGMGLIAYVVHIWRTTSGSAMVPPFDIFKRQGGGSVRWLGVAIDLEAAKLRVRELAESVPGEYFIFSLATGHRLDMKMTDANNGSTPSASASNPG